MAKRKYYRLDGTIEDTDQEKTNESLESINKRMQLEKPALAKVAETVKPTVKIETPKLDTTFTDRSKQSLNIQPIQQPTQTVKNKEKKETKKEEKTEEIQPVIGDKVKSYKETKLNLKNAENDLKVANDIYNNRLKREIEKTGVEYGPNFKNLRDGMISYQTKDEDLPKSQPTPYNMKELTKNLDEEQKGREEAFRNYQIANYENNLAKVNQEKTTFWDQTLMTPVRAVGDLFSPLTEGSNDITDEKGNKIFLPSYNEIKQQKVRQDTPGIGGLIQDIGYNATKIGAAGALDAVTGGMGGKALYWTDMAADNFKNVKNQGYDNKDAVINTIIATGSEFLTERLLGGLSKNLTGGKVSGIQKGISNAVNKLVKNPKIANLIGSMGSEGIEEFVQEWIGALNNKVTLGQDINYEQTLKDSLYSFAVGAGSAGLTTGANNVEGRMTQNNINDVKGAINELQFQRNNIDNQSIKNDIDNAIKVGQDYINNPFTTDYNKTINSMADVAYKNVQDAANNVQPSINTNQIQNNAENAQNDTIKQDVNNFNLGKFEQNNIDNSTNMAYNESTNAKEGVNNEFRKLQEASRSLSKEQHESLYRGDKSGIKGVREDIRRVLQPRMESIISSNNDNGKSLRNGYTEVNNNDFQEIFELNQPYLRNPDTVTVYKADDYKNNKNYLSDDGLSGFSISPDGDLISVFNNSGKPGMLQRISDTVKNNAKTLDCFSSPIQDLPGMYEDAFGFKTAAIMDYNYDIMADEHGKEYADAFVEKYGEAPVHFMVKSDQDIEVKHFNKDQYEEALNYRNSFVDNEGTSNATESQNQTNENLTQEDVENKIAKILDKVPEKNKKTPFRDKISQLKQEATRLFVDKGETIRRISEATGNHNLYWLFDRMGLSRNESQNKIGEVQTDLNGKIFNNFKDSDGNNTTMSINGIMEDAKANDIDNKTLNEYLAHYLNVDRYKQGKPVFGFDVNENVSRNMIKTLEANHPEIKRIAQNVWQYNKNQLKTMVDSGLISQKFADELTERNPHYVRIQRDVESSKNKGPVIDRKGRLQINRQIDTAKGSNIDILPIMETMAEFTNQVNESMRKNLFAQELTKTLSMGANDSDTNFITDEESFGINPELVKDNGDGTYTMTSFKDGVATVTPIDKGIYEALTPNKVVQAIENNNVFKFATYLPKKASAMFRGLTTDKNPMFMATNFFKDIGDAPFNSKYTTTFYQNYAKAMADKATNGNYSKLYNNLGGNQNSYFQDGRFSKDTKTKAGKVIDKIMSPIETGNEYIESLPRLAEFMSTINANGYEVTADGELVPRKGFNPTRSVDNVLNEALYNAAEITTNFKRGGDVSKMLNRNGFTFLNASIQGFSKQIRNFTDIKNPKQAVHLLTKALIFGIAPTMLNDAMYDDDDEYKEMQEYQKDNYYLFKTGDGKWVRIPKGRAMSVLGSAARRTKNFAKGDKDAYSGLVKFASNQVAPNSVFENNILAPLSQIKNNKSWSGNAIINQSMLKKASNEQYNEKTDAFSKWLGEQIKDIPISKEAKKEGYGNFKSPMAINYLLDQYTGVIGDVFLPMTAPKAASGDNPLVAPFTSKFTADAAYSNKSVGDFYDLKEEIDETSSKDTNLKKVQRKYMNSMNSELSGLYKEQHEIQNNPDLSKKEKYKQAREKQEEINKVAKEVVNNVKNAKEEDGLIKMGNTYYTVSQDDKGAEKIKPITKENMKSIKEANIPVEEFAMVDAIITEMSADKNSQGKTISGSKKKKAINFLEEAGYDDNQIKAIVEAQGWKY